MGLCGSQTGCGCAIVSSGSTPGSAIGGFLPTIAVSGAGSGGDPFQIDLNTDWTEELASQLSDAQADILTNAGAILTNAGDISTNAGDIATNAADIAALQSANDGDVTFQSDVEWGNTAGRWTGFTITTLKIFARATITVPTGKQAVIVVHAGADVQPATNSTAVGILRIRENGANIVNEGLRGTGGRDTANNPLRITVNTHVTAVRGAGTYNWDAYWGKSINDGTPWGVPTNQHCYIRAAAVIQ